MIEGNVIIFDDNDDPERYSGEEYEYEMEEMEEGDEELEEADEEEKQLIKQEQEIGAFVPITFEDFNSMYRSPAEMAADDVAIERSQEAIPAPQPSLIERSSSKKGTKDSLLARKKPPKGAVNKLIYGLHKDPIVIPTDETEPPSTIRAHEPVPPVEKSENVSAKVEAKSVLTALLSEIPSPPIEPDHAFVTLVPTESKHSTPVVRLSGQSSGSVVTQPPVKSKHVEFLLPEREEPDYEPESESELELSSPLPATDNGSKENLFIPQDTSEEEFEPNEYTEEYGEYAEEEEEIVYEDEEEEVIDDIESVLLNQYGSDEEEEPLTDDNIPPGGDEEDASDVDDSDLMRRLEEKYGKLPATEANATPAADGNDDDDEATAAGWTSIYAY
uniref:Uncharacterized protein n=1 Tax=Anopheles maculatus TaxID=74869 RepID=A0A182T4V1_9DIPT